MPISTSVVDWPALGAEAVEHLRRLIRFDTTNPPGNELPAARYVAETLSAAGIETTIVEAAPERGNAVARLRGTADRRPILLLSHLDVVPAEPSRWTHPPFAGDLADGFVWGRGAVDCKLVTAVGMTALLQLQRMGTPLRRDLILAATSSEEMGGPANGAAWLSHNRPDLVGAEFVLNEAGGFAVEIGGRRFYFCQTAEKGGFSVDLVVRGTPGHASIPHDDNAILKLGPVLARMSERKFPVHLVPSTERFFRGIAGTLDPTGKRAIEDMVADVPGAVDRVPTARRTALFMDAMLRNTAAPTIVQAGYKRNVIPSEVTVQLSGRPLPGQTAESFTAELRAVAGPGAEVQAGDFNPGLEFPPDTALFDAIARTVQRHDPDAVTLPYMTTGGTDAKRLQELGAVVYGFLPMRYERGFDYMEQCHNHDERVSLENLEFGVKVLTDVILELNR